jgi:hypothetical protein
MFDAQQAERAGAAMPLDSPQKSIGKKANNHV